MSSSVEIIPPAVNVHDGFQSVASRTVPSG
jgi:hypothetical protein